MITKSDMNTCGTCKHWQREDPDEYMHIDNIGKCTMVTLFWEATTWDANYERRLMAPGFENKKAFVQDGSDYKSSLHSFPDFGCNQWEAKPDQAKAAG